MSVSQLTLNINLRDDVVLENFFSGQKNRQLLRTLHETARGRGENFLYLWGSKGVGRTHLLQASCHTANRLKLPHFYLSLSDFEKLEPAILDNLESLYLICLDDVESIAGNAAWEEALFDVINRVREAGKRLVIAGDFPPVQSAIHMPDIKSRLSQAMVYQVHALSDAEKLEALCSRANARGLRLSDAVAQFLFRHCRRNMGSLFQVLDQLDQASLEAQRKLTVPFVKEVLGI